jgi:hypothetical protein
MAALDAESLSGAKEKDPFGGICSVKFVETPPKMRKFQQNKNG